MATAAQIIDALATALGKTSSSIEAYALFLRRTGRWLPTKRGRGAKPVTDGEAARLFLAAMSDGDQLADWWLHCANLCLLPDLRSDPVTNAVAAALGLGPEAFFLDYLEAIFSAFRDRRAEKIFAPDTNPIGALAREVWLPGVDISVSGPVVRAEVAFWLLPEFVEKHDLFGLDHGPITPHRLLFVDQVIGWRADAAERGEDPSFYDGCIAARIEERSKGVRYRRTLGSNEIEAIARVMRSPEDHQ